MQRTVHVRYLGDVAKAALWKQFALKKRTQWLTAAGGRPLSHVVEFELDGHIRIRAQTLGNLDLITIEVSGSHAHGIFGTPCTDLSPLGFGVPLLGQGDTWGKSGIPVRWPSDYQNVMIQMDTTHPRGGRYWQLAFLTNRAGGKPNPPTNPPKVEHGAAWSKTLMSFTKPFQESTRPDVLRGGPMAVLNGDVAKGDGDVYSLGPPQTNWLPIGSYMRMSPPYQLYGAGVNASDWPWEFPTVSYGANPTFQYRDNYAYDLGPYTVHRNGVATQMTPMQGLIRHQKTLYGLVLRLAYQELDVYKISKDRATFEATYTYLFPDHDPPWNWGRCEAPLFSNQSGTRSSGLIQMVFTKDHPEWPSAYRFQHIAVRGIVHIDVTLAPESKKLIPTVTFDLPDNAYVTYTNETLVEPDPNNEGQFIFVGEYNKREFTLSNWPIAVGYVGNTLKIIRADNHRLADLRQTVVEQVTVVQSNEVRDLTYRVGSTTVTVAASRTEDVETWVGWKSSGLLCADLINETLYRYEFHYDVYDEASGLDPETGELRTLRKPYISGRTIYKNNTAIHTESFPPPQPKRPEDLKQFKTMQGIPDGDKDAWQLYPLRDPYGTSTFEANLYDSMFLLGAWDCPCYQYQTIAVTGIFNITGVQVLEAVNFPQGIGDLIYTAATHTLAWKGLSGNTGLGVAITQDGNYLIPGVDSGASGYLVLAVVFNELPATDQTDRLTVAAGAVTTGGYFYPSRHGVAVDYAGNVLVSLYIPEYRPEWAFSNFETDSLHGSAVYNTYYETWDILNQFPKGHKYMFYNSHDVNQLLGSLPPGNDFFIKELGVF